MKPRQGTWDEVQPGSFVLDQSGKAWKVETFRFAPMLGGDTVALVDREGGKAEVPMPPLDRPVTLLAPEPGLEVAIARLGARVICEPFAPPGTPDLMSARHHLRQFHGIHADGITTVAQAHEAHTWAESVGKVTTPHIHQELM